MNAVVDDEVDPSLLDTSIVIGLMAGLDPNENVRMMNFAAARLLQKHMDPPLSQPTWNKFVLSANKWLTRRGRTEDKVDLVNMRGGPGSATDKILTDLGHKGCLVADLIGILEDAEMHDILQSEEFKLRPNQETQSKAGRYPGPHCPCSISSPGVHARPGQLSLAN